jgi:hypothetical protein
VDGKRKRLECGTENEFRRPQLAGQPDFVSLRRHTTNIRRLPVVFFLSQYARYAAATLIFLRPKLGVSGEFIIHLSEIRIFFRWIILCDLLVTD